MGQVGTGQDGTGQDVMGRDIVDSTTHGWDGQLGPCSRGREEKHHPELFTEHSVNFCHARMKEHTTQGYK